MPDDQITSDFEPQPPKSPRVALIASRRTIDEYPLYLKFLLVGLADESVPVLLICPPRVAVDSLIPPTVEVVRHPAIDIPLMERYNRKLLLDRLAEFQPDLLHCLCETRASLVRWLARRLDVNYLLNINSFVSRFNLLPLSPTRLSAIVAPTKTIADNFAAGNPKFADRVRQINIGTFIDDTTACFAHPERLPGIIVAQPWDNPADIQNLLGAFHRLTIDGYQFMVALIAAGRTEKHIWKQLHALGLLRVVTIVPRLPELYSAISAADIFIVPRPSFSFNSLLLAAMSAGSAVAACTGGVDDLIIDGKTALVFNPNDQLSIYNCLKHIFDAKEMARQIASNAQQHLRQSHHVSDMVGSTLSLYRQAARHQTPE
ncbi:MAG: glycosyltransferase [Sedimentisphaerales bacterium]|jgi:glycosyltransferase involved in cell wall biosynthesis